MAADKKKLIKKKKLKGALDRKKTKPIKKDSKKKKAIGGTPC